MATGKKNTWKELFGFLILTACGMAGMLLFVYRAGWLVDSDLAGELMLSFKLNEEGSILSRNWIYSTELRVFETQWFYRIGAFLFPHNWSRARLTAVMLLLLLSAVCSYFFARCAKFGKYAKLYSFLLMMPIGHVYFFYAIWGLYYQPYLIFIHVTLGCLFLFKDRTESGKRSFIPVLAASAIAVMSGCNGFRQMQILYLPLFASALFLLTAKVRKSAHTLREIPARCGSEWSIFLFSFALCVFNCVGIVINRLLSRAYDFKTFNDLRLMKGNERTYGELLWDYLTMFGYQGDLSLFSIRGIISLLGLILAFSVVFSAVRIAWKYRTRSTASQFCLILFLAELAVNLTVFKFLDYYSFYHLLPLIPFGMALIVLELKEEPTALRGTRAVAGAAVVLMFIVCSAATVQTEIKEPTWADKDRVALTEWMLESGITQAAASYWDSDVLTELSNGQIEMWTLEWGWGWNLGEEYLKPFRWLQDVSHMERFPEGKMYLIYNEKESGPKYGCAILKKGRAIHEFGAFSIWEYDSAKDVFGDLVKD